MTAEIWRYMREKLSDFITWKKKLLLTFWRYLTGYLTTLSFSTWRKVLFAIPATFFLYIGLAMPFVHTIDDAINPQIAQTKNGSAVVDTLIYLVNREINIHQWTPNDPFFYPGFYLDNMPNYQKGMISAISRFTFELRDQIGRIRSSSAADPDLMSVSGNLSKEPDVWVFGGGNLLPKTSADSYYRDGLKALKNYNDRIANGTAVFERRSDNLLATLERIASDLGSSSAAQDQYIANHAGGLLPDFGVDDEFYQIKGQVYAYTLILKALGQDFSSVIKDRELDSLYSELILSMENAVSLDPLVVTNGKPDGILPNHLSIQGFYLLRARTQLKEITNVLLK